MASASFAFLTLPTEIRLRFLPLPEHHHPGSIEARNQHRLSPEVQRSISDSPVSRLCHSEAISIYYSTVIRELTSKDTVRKFSIHHA
jgi:hypothetical protein